MGHCGCCSTMHNSGVGRGTLGAPIPVANGAPTTIMQRFRRGRTPGRPAHFRCRHKFYGRDARVCVPYNIQHRPRARLPCKRAGVEPRPYEMSPGCVLKPAECRKIRRFNDVSQVAKHIPGWCRGGHWPPVSPRNLRAANDRPYNPHHISIARHAETHSLWLTTRFPPLYHKSIDSATAK